MLYRTYRAPTYKEAVLKAKMDLGADVYIIGRKEIKDGGFLGLFTKTYTEITVAKNEDAPGPAGRRSGQGQGDRPAGSAQTGSGYSGAGKQQDTRALTALSAEIGELKVQLQKLLNGGGQGSPGALSPESPAQGAPGPAGHVPVFSPRERRSLDRLVEVLRENDFSEEYIERVRRRFESELTLKDLDTEGALEKTLRAHIMDRIRTADPIQAGNGKPQVVVLVGPTGVGKTTTIAKLAASFGVLQKRRVELLTIDSYRIAAVEQLQKYAELMQIPFTPVTSREEFKNTVSASSAEFMFVDTVGRSQRNNMGLAELRNILDGVKSPMDVHLVISATTKYRDAVDITARFNQLMYRKVIISKLDETNSIGSILSVLNPERRLSYFTTGQGVPDDIEIARKDKLLNLLDLEGLREKTEE